MFELNNSQSSTRQSLSLELEPLEERMMLSTVSIFAMGSTGQENLELQIDGQTVQTFENVATDGQTLTYETSQSVSPGQVRIAFTNDHYEPGVVDRNLTVEKIVIDGQEYLTSDPAVFSTGAWDPAANAIVQGFGKGDTLHANGIFQFSDSTAVEQIEFAGKTWNVGQGTATDQTLAVDGAGGLTMSGINGELSISTELNVVGGEIHQLSYTAARNILAGEFSSDSGPWATVGINYYDSVGRYLGQNQSEVNHTDPRTVERDFRVPDNAVTGYLWIWMEGFEDGDNIPLQISNLDFEPVDFSQDTTPPTAFLPPFTMTQPNSVVSFTIDFSDDQRLGQYPTNVVTITNPDGVVVDHYIATGFNVTETFQTVLFEFPRPGGGEFGPSDNGEYTVVLNDNLLVDEAGNGAAGRELGTITLDIASA
jgi:hypothetical protein